ncbi:HAD family hydrolase [Catellatospora chokoriensis]|uniref:Haloacid dehalogenase n=1 Tax=Catellatospora chokoriensis TaxID=310353 RepID=A0A8J3JVW8_9ACTN|nr:HAD family hydrolase [Catellatospora chokoriensis]GIF92031.1 haloacid dehalogenase [Catellatospora chokoriensis]
MIKAVVFDADETLLDLRPAIDYALEQVLGSLRLLAPDLAPTREQMRDDWSAVFAEDPEAPVPHIRRESMRRTLARFGMEQHLNHHCDLFFHFRYQQTRPFPDALATLARLRESYLVGYATNGNSTADRCGLGGEFAFELYAHQGGLPKKPAPEFFAAVAAAAGAKPGEIAYVGDNYHHDVQAPAAAGMRTVWVNRAGHELPGPVVPDLVIERLAQLPDGLSRLATWDGVPPASDGAGR